MSTPYFWEFIDQSKKQGSEQVGWLARELSKKSLKKL